MRKHWVIFLFLAIFIKQILWSAFIPLWHFPDEQAHFGQVQLFSEIGGPKKTGNNLSREIHTSEKLLGTDRDPFGNNKFTYHSDYNISYTNSLIGQFEREINSLPFSSRTQFVKVESTGYPPLYYFVSGVIYKTAYLNSLVDRVFLVRIFNSFLFLGIVLAAFKIGREIFSRQSQVIALTILVGFMPMLSFVQAGVTSDALFNLLFAWFIYFCLRLINAGIQIKTLIFIGVILWLSFLTKPQANIMCFLLLPLIAWLIIRDKKVAIGALLSFVIVFYAMSGIIERIVAGVSIFPESNGRAINFDLKSIIEHLDFTLKHTYSEVLPWYWGVFRWLSLGLPDILRKITNWLTILSFIGFVLFIFRRLVEKKLDRKFQMIIFCAISIIIYFLAITAFDYGFRLSHGFSFGIQGRYFFPVVTTQMVILLIGLTFGLNSTWQNRMTKLLAVGMVIFNLLTFFWVVGSYYSLEVPAFFIQASQYKPAWLKFPVNFFIFISTIAAFMGCITFILRSREVK